MSWNRLSRRIGLYSLFALLAICVAGAALANTALARYPTLHGNTVVFEAYGNLWKVDRTGGTAQRLTTDAGYDMMPRY